MSYTEKKIKNPLTNRSETIYEAEGLAKITATSSSIECMNVVVHDHKELDRFAKLISLAWQEHSRLKAEIKKSLMQ